MNILHEGAHAAADWLGIKVRSYCGGVALYVSRAGELVAVRACTARERIGFERVGIYTKSLKYREAVDDLSHLAQELEQARAA
jgi:hypothetical protein